VDPQKKFYLESILNAGRNLLSIINDILDLSKVEAGHFDLQYTPIELDPLLNELKHFFNHKVLEKGLSLNVQAPCIDKALLVDAARLRQVLINLIKMPLNLQKRG